MILAHSFTPFRNQYSDFLIAGEALFSSVLCWEIAKNENFCRKKSAKKQAVKFFLLRLGFSRLKDRIMIAL
ncbi:hypothetical protein [Agathobaculum sp.]|uniref:hypothetical protein n=1 Tax=Agathobaculum sp. TaxID=2048138 RepID=UPI003D904E15